VDDDDRVEEEDVAGFNALMERLRRAVNSVNLGAARTWTLDKRASYCLRIIGSGGTVSLENPSTVRRAITVLENYKQPRR
tara:strand:+ start:393 stop:632 length:240 start_codon:yes stop_codon:yes gene_type:complete